MAQEDITDYPEEEMERIRKKVTMVFQNGALFDSLSVGENVAFPLRERGDLNEAQIYQIVDGLLEMVNVGNIATNCQRAFHGDEALGGDCARAGRTAGGNPLRRADDQVDPLTAHLLGDLIQKLKHQLKLTSIVVTHDMALAKTGRPHSVSAMSRR